MKSILDTRRPQADRLPQNFAQTSLGKLPLEIRLQIYELAALTEIDPWQSDVWVIVKLAKPCDHPELHVRNCLQLLWVCRQIYEEAMDIVYSGFYSRCSLYFRDAAALHDFLTTPNEPRLQHITSLSLGPELVDRDPVPLWHPIHGDQDDWHLPTDRHGASKPSVRFVSWGRGQARFGDRLQECRHLLAKCTVLRVIKFQLNIQDRTAFIKWLSPTIPERPTHCIEIHSKNNWTLCPPHKMEQAARSHAIWVPIIEDIEWSENIFDERLKYDKTLTLRVALEATPAEIFGETDIPRESEGGTIVERRGRIGLASPPCGAGSSNMVICGATVPRRHYERLSRGKTRSWND